MGAEGQKSDSKSTYDLSPIFNLLMYANGY